MLEVKPIEKTRRQLPEMPKRFWADSDWVNAHLGEIANNHPNCWVIVYEMRVIAAHRDLGIAEDSAEKIIGSLDEVFPVILYAEKGRHVF